MAMKNGKFLVLEGTVKSKKKHFKVGETVDLEWDDENAAHVSAMAGFLKDKAIAPAGSAEAKAPAAPVAPPADPTNPIAPPTDEPSQDSGFFKKKGGK